MERTLLKFYVLIFLATLQCFCKEHETKVIDILIHMPQLQFMEDGSKFCKRSWLTRINAQQLKDSLTEIINIRNISYIQYEDLYNKCKDKFGKGPCPLLYRSPFFLKWSFSSTLTCYTSANKLFIQLYISFESIKTKFMSRYEPISQNPLVFGKSLKNVVKLYSQNFNGPEVINAARFRNMRDFYNISESHAAIAKLTLELLAWHNLTYILPNETNEFEMEALVPGIHTKTLLNTNNSNILYHRNGIYYETQLYANFLYVDYNFVYCDVPKSGKVDLLDFSPLLLPFYPTVWFLTIASTGILSLMILCKIKVKKSVSKDLRQRHASELETFLNIVCSLISSLISCPVYFGLKRELKYSELYCFWLFVCLILYNFYTGICTSLMIQPIPDKTLDELKDLVENNYSLLYSRKSPGVFDGTLDIIKSRNFSDGSKAAEFLKVLMTDNPKGQIYPWREFVNKLVFEDKTAAFGPWPYVLSIYQKATMVIKHRDKQQNAGDKSKIICRLGQKMINSAPILWQFYPPNVEWIYETYLIFIENGIDGLWTREFYGQNIVSRVQDRAKIKSLTKMETQWDTALPKAITLYESHFITVVTLGIACTIICVVCLVLELCIYKSYLSSTTTVKCMKLKCNNVETQVSYIQ